jgi:hypothetical protein
MAFVDLDHDDPVKFSSFYNVNGAVGYGGSNLMEDVKVVQFFLSRFYTVMTDFKKPWGTMTPDGKVGPITRAWITKFQIDARNNNANVMVDGLIDKAGNENNASNWDTSISHTNYAIRILNSNLLKNDTEVYKMLDSHPIVPPDIKMIFLNIHAAGPPMHYSA